MKKIYALLGLAVIGFTANAQRNLTLNCEIINPTYNYNVITGSTVNWQYRITNNSATPADSLQIGDTIKIFDPASRHDGTAFATYTGNVVLTSTIPRGGTLTISTSTPLAFANILTLADPADGLKYKSAPFTNNKQYAWFFSIYQISIPAKNIPIAATSTATPDTTLIWINKSTGMVEFANNKIENLNTYPNPATTQLSFEHNFEQEANAQVKVTDVSGRVVMSKSYNNQFGRQKFDLDINALSNGSYILQLLVDDKTWMSKFNVQK